MRALRPAPWANLPLGPCVPCVSGADFLGRKDKIVAALRDQIDHGNLDLMARIRANKATL